MAGHGPDERESREQSLVERVRRLEDRLERLRLGRRVLMDLLVRLEEERRLLQLENRRLRQVSARRARLLCRAARKAGPAT